MHRVYMSFMLSKGWHCQFLEPDLKTPLRKKLALLSQDKLFEMAQRGGAVMDLEAQEAMYAARVRAGLIPATRRELHKTLQPLTVKTCPFANLPESTPRRWGQGLTAAKMRECVWVRPELVANFEFLEWTDTNHVRHIEFVGLRRDKAAKKVVRET